MMQKLYFIKYQGNVQIAHILWVVVILKMNATLVNMSGIVYEKITKFIPKEIDVPDVFICAENNKLMCTERFKSLVEEKQLKGLSFVEMRY